MIYLIITTCIRNRFGIQDDNERRERYINAISETLKHVPPTIQPIIVENNGQRQTYLDNFIWNEKPVQVIYTNNNQHTFRSKGVNELMDIKEVIHRLGIHDTDMIIKLTGRYKVFSPIFFKYIIKHANNFDAFIKFFGVESLQFEQNDCVLGMYAMRVMYLKLFNHISIDNFDSAEIAYAKYARLSIPRLKEIENLYIECNFAKNQQELLV